MSTTPYAELITKTFRDNAIRSVMMIDDDFLTYDKLIALEGVKDESGRSLLGSKKAANLHRFFQEKKLVCDIDNGTEHLDADKVRKCDLIILDYHLENDDPSRSISLIKKLRDNDHMNLVVIYTSEDLDEAWMQLASCLRGSYSQDCVEDFCKDIEDEWEEFSESGSIIPDDAMDLVDESILVAYLKDGTVARELKTNFARAYKQYAKNSPKFCTLLLEAKLRERNLIKSDHSPRTIRGARDDVKWLQSGNVFVALHNKGNADENDAEPLWNTLTKALTEWNPSYFQVVVSELQNWFENEPLPFDLEFSSDIEGKAAWLSSIIKKQPGTQRDELISQLFERFGQELNARLLASTQLKKSTAALFDYLSSEVQKTESKDTDIYSAMHFQMFKEGDDLAKVKMDMYHSLNVNLCSRKFTGEHITNGTILCDSDKKPHFYLCVSPACDAVPEQKTSDLSRRISPNRILKVIALENHDLEEALSIATRSQHVFVQHKGIRYALSTLSLSSMSPMIDYLVVHGHETRDARISENGIKVSFLKTLPGSATTTLEQTTLIPIAQLRDSYTARFQTNASYHTGRVGVDYVSFPERARIEQSHDNM